MSKLDILLGIANIEIMVGSFHSANNLNEVWEKRTAQTVKGRRGSLPGFLRHPSNTEMDNYFKAAGFLAGYTDYDKKHTHWCGIFQTYLLKKAGVACSWKREIVDESGGTDLDIVKGNDAQKDLETGDIVRIHHNEHHFMVINPVKSGYIRSFEGNAGGIKHAPLLAANWMGNARYNVVEDVYIRYRVIS